VLSGGGAADFQPMKLVIFAGGIGTRLWPLSRVNSPKQFDKIFNGASTLQLAFSRIAPVFGATNIFIQTVEAYRKIIIEQLPDLPRENIFIEPARRDLGAAVCFAAVELRRRGYAGAMAILWSDHLMKRTEEFTGALSAAEKLIDAEPDRFIFLAERPRFANNNLGWIKLGAKVGEKDKFALHRFGGWKYRPAADECGKIFEQGDYFWNPGYFITSIDFLWQSYQRLAPEIFTPVSSGNYDQAPKKHFDEAIIEKLDLSRATVVKVDMGWSDPGTLYALKEALQKSCDENVAYGRIAAYNTEDCLLYNLEKDKVLATVGLSGMVVINMPDALLVVPKSEVVHVTKLIKKMEESGLEKYL
jgi:mannose-1-phosphate guanylyltransferase